MSKVKSAQELIESVNSKSPEQIGEMVMHKAGEDLAVFFDMYASHILKTAPFHAKGLMLLGYMCRVHEESAGLEMATQKKGLA